MRRLAWSQLRFRTVRMIALLGGILLATTAFTVLTAASRTAQLRTVGTVSAHFVPAYDILVRPKGASTALENKTDTVQPNFLSGIYGGITTAQYRKIAHIPGVQVAAPVAMVGYTLLVAPLTSQLPAADYAEPGRQLYRISTTWVSAAGTSRIAQPPSYEYVTPNPLRSSNSSAATAEVLPNGSQVTVCPGQSVPAAAAANPFGTAAQSNAYCWSKANGGGPGSGADERNPSSASFYDGWVIPMLIAAVDPAAEAKLDGLNHAVMSGHYLPELAHSTSLGPTEQTFPVLASVNVGMNQYAVTQLAELATPSQPPVMSVSWMTGEATAPGRTVLTTTTSAQQAYRQVLRSMSNKTGPVLGIFQYWNAGPTTYRRSASGALSPALVDNPISVWYSGFGSKAPVENEDNQYRKLTDHAPATAVFGGSTPIPRLVGIFDPAKIASFDPLSQVPLGPYQPVAAVPASAASKRALGGSGLLPNLNLGGFVSQPVDLITSLSALPVLQSSLFGGNLHAGAPISVIRVRVAGVTGPNPVSLERIREAAQQVEVRTGLDVDIVAGSSPSPTTIDLPAGKFGQPALTLSENWVRKGVAIAILTAIDKDSLVLFALILIVCVLFVANSASAAIRGRRRELGVLACVGWTKPRLFAAVLGELAAVGLTAGLLGAAAALPLSSALGLHASLGRAALAVPIAVAVALIAGLVPAWLAARAEPVASVRPPVLGVRRARQPGGISGLAAVNVLRTPGRAAVGAVSLAVGVTALTILAAVTFAFRGVVVGSLLGNAVAVQVRGVDYVAVTATVALGVLAVADVVYLNIRERAPELAAIRTFGWRETALNRLVVTEGAIVGLVGSFAGAALGLALAAQFAGQLPATLYLVAVAAVVGGLFVTTTAALLPAQALRRLPAAHLLAEE